MSLKAIDIFDGARALLNDQDNTIFTDTVQLSYFKIAYEELKQECLDNNIPITNKTTSAISIPQGTTDIGGPTGPPLPRDLVEVLECWEIPANTNDDYMLMRRLQFLPKTSVLTAYLEVYTWSDQKVNFLGANGDIQVKLDYIANDLGLGTDANSVIRVFNATNVLKFRTASLCARFIGEDTERADTLDGFAVRALDIFLNIPIKNAQGIQTRRRPFMAAYKQRGAMYGR